MQRKEIKINSRGQITIPKELRKMIGFFPGIKCEAVYVDYYSYKGILIKPYNYKCKECGNEIPEGKIGDFCPECQEKHSVKVY